jgi:uncharacterized protein
MTRSFAVITGASSGIGFELAKQFAEHDFDLFVTAEDAELEQAAAQLSAMGASVEAVGADLRSPAAVADLYAAIQATGRPVDALALNAGVGQGGAFIDTALADDQEIIDLNITSTVHLAKLVLQEMARRDEGRVLITSSIASTMPGSFQPIYNASKSFLQSFAEAVQEELKDTGVTITSLMPGPTDTNFFRRGNMLNTVVGRMPKDDPSEVARQGYEALMRGERKVVAASLMTKAMGLANRVLPDSVKAVASRAISSPVR